MSSSVLPVFSCKSFIVYSLTFRSLIHFEFIFAYGVRKCSNFILLHVAVQFSQHHLLKRLSLPPLYIASFVKNKVSIGAWVYFWAFCLVPLIYISVLCQYHTVLVTVALYYNLKSGRLIPPASFSFSRLLWLFTVFCVSI